VSEARAGFDLGLGLNKRAGLAKLAHIADITALQSPSEKPRS
jgi:hypothetical protein